MSNDQKIDVAVMMGSKSDLETMRPAAKICEKLGLAVEVRVLSAHRTPEETAAFVKDAVRRGVKAFICGAGGAAHLAGAVSAHTTRPVIGVPIANGALSGFDSLLSTVQMPPGMPVATVAVNGAENAGLLAAQIAAVADAVAGREGGRRADGAPPEGAGERRRGPRRNQEVSDLVAAAVAALGRGEVVAYPTETFYGLGVDAFDAAALERVRVLKGRGDKAISMLIDGDEMLARLVAEVRRARATIDGLALAGAADPGLAGAPGPARRAGVGRMRGGPTIAAPGGAGAGDGVRWSRHHHQREPLRRSRPPPRRPWSAPRWATGATCWMGARRRAARPARWRACAANRSRSCARALSISERDGLHHVRHQGRQTCDTRRRMAVIAPFPGLRYDAARVGDLGRVLAPPYDVIGEAEQAALEERHPQNVVRVELPRGESDARYAEAARLLQSWRSEGILQRDPTPAFYVYEQQFRLPGAPAGSRVYARRGFFAAVRLEPFERRVIAAARADPFGAQGRPAEVDARHAHADLAHLRAVPRRRRRGPRDAGRRGLGPARRGHDDGRRWRTPAVAARRSGRHRWPGRACWPTGRS